MGNRCSHKKEVPKTRIIHPSTTVHFDEYGQPFNPNTRYANNRIRTTKYSIWTFLPLNLWEQFHRFANVYFVFILILNFMPGINAFAKEVAPIPVLLTLAVIAVKDAYEDFRRNLSDRRVNNRMCKVFSIMEARYVNAKWESILPGDFVRLHTNEMIPADILLLKSSNVAGICHIETANLDGESNLKQREVVERGAHGEPFSPLNFIWSTEVETPSPELYKFSGKIIRPAGIVPIRKNSMILRGCVLRNTDFIEGMVIYAGRETKAALNNSGPRFKRSKLERRINMDVIWCVMILAAICFTGALGSGVWQANLPGDDVLFVALDRNATTSSPAFQGFLNFWRFIILFQSIIPLPLYVSIELIKMHQVWHMHNDLALYDPRVDRRVEVRAFNILEDLGQIEYVFCDKTGTLTENKMEFKRASINGIEYATDVVAASATPDEQHVSRDSLRGAQRFALQDIVKEMSLLTVSAREPVPREPKVTSEEALRLMRHKNLIDDFILILTICNTVVVSATKNTATLFQVPTRRRGLKAFHHRWKQRGKSTTEVGIVRHAFSLSSLLSRKRRQRKAEVSAPVPQFETPDEQEEECMDNGAESLVDTIPTVRITQPFGTNREVLISATIEQAEIADDESSSDLPVKAFGPSRKASTETGLPPLVPGLSLDIPTPNALQVRKPSLRKSASAHGVQWKPTESDAENSCVDSDAASSFSLDVPTTGRAPTPGTDNDRLSADFDCDQCSTRTLTVVAHDGSAYEIQVDKDFMPDTDGSGACPLSDTLLLDSYESESPDEITLVKAACQQGCKLLQRGLDFVLLWLPADGLVGVRVLHILPFDSVRKRMSILIRHPATDQAILLTKGADSSVLDRVRCSTDQEKDRLKLTRQHIDEFSRTGLRTLVFAKRIIPEDELESWSREFIMAEATASDNGTTLQALMDRIERDFTLVGATGIEDRLQPGVPETIEHLREAGMHVWILTGDKQETAVNVAHSARLITDDHRLIFINAANKLRTSYLLNSNLHSILSGQSWVDTTNLVDDVMSDDPDLGSSSSSTSSVSAVGDTETVRDNLNGSRENGMRLANTNGPVCDALNRGRQSKQPRRRNLLRSVSETRLPRRRRRKLRPRTAHKNYTKFQTKPPLPPDMTHLALVIDGETLQFALEDDVKFSFLRLARLCSSVLCCRSTPSQKAAVVSLVKDGLSVLTLAIGDGANDVNMIQAANIGVGLGGEEGMQAVMASDFAISRFRFLERLIIVHGHMCYEKLAHTALYLFYKDAIYIFLLFWFQLFNGFSGSNVIDQLSQVLFSITYTGLPPFLMGIWDNPTDPDILQSNPVLYRAGIKDKAYRPWLFWVNILDAVWQSLIIYFVPFLFYMESTMTVWRFGVLQTNLIVICCLIHAALETRTWVILHGIVLVFSYLIAWVGFTMIYHAIAVTGIAPESPCRVIFVAMHDGVFWLLTLVTVVAALLPRFLFIAINNTLTPSLDTVATVLSKVYGCGRRLPLRPYLIEFSDSLDQRVSTQAETLSTVRSSTSIPQLGPTDQKITDLSPENIEVGISERPVSFGARIEQLLSVSGRLFRGAAPTTTATVHEEPVAHTTGPVSLVNLRRSRPSIMTDLRHRCRRAETISYGPSRLDAVARPGGQNANNFDDNMGLPSAPVIWPVVDPTTRFRSLTTNRSPRGRSPRPVLDDSVFRQHVSGLSTPGDPARSGAIHGFDRTGYREHGVAHPDNPPPPYYPIDDYTPVRFNTQHRHPPSKSKHDRTS